jgi:hypothetical protein
MRAGGDAAEDRVGGIEVTPVRWRGAGEQAAAETEGQGGLADAVRTGDQPGMVDAAGAEGIQKCRLGVGMAEKQGIRAGIGGGQGGRLDRIAVQFT